MTGKTKDTGLSERIKYLLELKGYTSYQASIDTKISQSTFSHILSGKTKKISTNTANILSNYFNVDPYWLQTGKGEIRKSQNQYTNCEPGSPEFQNQLNELKLQNRILQERLDECRKLIYYMNNKDGPQKKYVAGDSVENRSTGSG
jgi:transcriptional regulator with XRE-family HTH domain